MYTNGYNSIPVMAGLKRWSKEIKKSKKIKEFDSFDSLINWDDVHTSYPNKGQCSTDKHFGMLIIMYTNGYNSILVMAGLKKRKNKSKIKLKIKDYLIINLPSPLNPLFPQPPSIVPILNEAPKLIK